MIVDNVRTYYISATSTCRTSLKIIDDEAIRHIIALGGVVNSGPGGADNIHNQAWFTDLHQLSHY